MIIFNVKWEKKCNIIIFLERGELEVLVISINDYFVFFNFYKRLVDCV